jgi:superoxide dismutase
MNDFNLTTLISVMFSGGTGFLMAIDKLIRNYRVKQQKSLTAQIIQKNKELAIDKSNYEKELAQIENYRQYKQKQAQLKYEKNHAKIQLELQAIKEQIAYEKAKNKLEIGLNDDLSVESLASKGSEIVKKEVGKITSSLKDKLSEDFGSLVDKLKK